jgi:hypothetical protein
MNLNVRLHRLGAPGQPIARLLPRGEQLDDPVGVLSAQGLEAPRISALDGLGEGLEELAGGLRLDRCLRRSLSSHFMCMHPFGERSSYRAGACLGSAAPSRRSRTIRRRPPDPTPNPYAPPLSAEDHSAASLGEVNGVWQELGVVVCVKGAPWPDRCVRCNEPAAGYRLKRDLYWHPS